MSDSVLQLTLSASVEEVLEKMFFFSPPEEPAADAESPDPEVAARVGFEGNPPGELTLRMARQAAWSIAADFLAAERCDLQEDQVDGVVCELANMICGSVLSRIESSTVFHLRSPFIVPGSEMVRGIAPDAAAHTVEMFGGALTVAMTLDAPGCTETAKYGC